MHTETRRCLITNETAPVDWATFRFEPAVVETPQLERAWGTKRAGLLRPQIALKADLAKTFDQGNWVLVPSLHVLKDIAIKALMYSHTSQLPPHYLTLFPGEEWSYHFVHLRRFPTVFVRVDDDHSSDRQSFELHQHPFESFPTIQSHADPYHVILDVAQKLMGHAQQDTPTSAAPSPLGEHLSLCMVIFSQWMGLRPNPDKLCQISGNDEGTQAVVTTQLKLAKRRRTDVETDAQEVGLDNPRPQSKAKK